MRRRGSAHIVAPLSAEDMAANDDDGFDAVSYLQRRYGDVHNMKTKGVLDQLHELFLTFGNDKKTLRVLDFGSGPVVQHGISVAPFAFELRTFSPPIARQFRNGWTETPMPSTGRLISTTSSRLSRERARRRPGRESSE